jgi:hypothetical protein
MMDTIKQARAIIDNSIKRLQAMESRGFGPSFAHDIRELEDLKFRLDLAIVRGQAKS